MKYRLSRSTKKKQLLEMLSVLKPMNTGHPLIRMGGGADGGYLIPDDLEGVTRCFSPGVDLTSDFELDCARRGMEVFMADASVDQPVVHHPHFHFEKIYVGGFSREDIVDFSQWVEPSLDPSGDHMLQMDIEGFEYETLYSASTDLLRKFRIIIVEFHNLERLFERSFYDLVMPLFLKLAQQHVCAHIHPNNYFGSKSSHGIEIPKLAEITFLRRDRIKRLDAATVFPHPLDRDCCRKTPLTLPGCWYE